MKKLVVIFCVLVFPFSICNAQTLNPGLFKVGNKKFKVAKSGLRSFENDQKITILNINYKYATVAPPKPKVANPFPMQKKDIHFDVLKVNDIVYQILNKKNPH